MPLSCRGDGLPGTASTWQKNVLGATTPFVVELAAGGIGSAAIRRHARAAIAAAEGR